MSRQLAPLRPFTPKPEAPPQPTAIKADVVWVAFSKNADDFNKQYKDGIDGELTPQGTPTIGYVDNGETSSPRHEPIFAQIFAKIDSTIEPTALLPDKIKEVRFINEVDMEEFNTKLAIAIKDGFLIADMARVVTIGKQIFYEAVFIKADKQLIQVVKSQDIN